MYSSARKQPEPESNVIPSRAPALSSVPRPQSSPRTVAVAAPIITVYGFVILALAETCWRGTVAVTGRSLYTVAAGCAFAALFPIIPIVGVLALVLAPAERLVARHRGFVVRAFRLTYLVSYVATAWWVLVRIVLPFLHMEATRLVYRGGYAIIFVGVAVYMARRGARALRIHPAVHLFIVALAAYWFHVEASYNVHQIKTYYLHLTSGALAFLLVLGGVIVTLCRRPTPARTIWAAFVGTLLLAALAIPFPSHWKGSFAARREMVDGSHVGRYAMRIALWALDRRGLDAIAARATPVPDAELGFQVDDGERLALGARVAATRPRNILLVTIDTLRRDAVSPELPAFGRLLSEAVSFDRTIATAPVTRPSLRSMLLGAYPDSPSHATLAEILDGAGFDTYHVSTFPNLAHDPVVRRGFDVVDERFLDLFNAPVGAPPLTDAVLGHIDEVGDQPFFVWVHYLDPHAPYNGDGWSDRERYADEVARMDAELGRLLDALQARGHLDDTLIVILSDHGEELGDHGGRWHGRSLHQTALRVPFLMRAPGGLVSGAVSTPVSGVDVGPTILRAMGIVAPAGFAPDGNDAFTAPVERGIYSRIPGRDVSIERGRWKLIVQPKFGAAELYDLAADPGEWNNLVDARTTVAAALARDLATHLGLTR